MATPRSPQSSKPAGAPVCGRVPATATAGLACTPEAPAVEVPAVEAPSVDVRSAEVLPPNGSNSGPATLPDPPSALSPDGAGSVVPPSSGMVCSVVSPSPRMVIWLPEASTGVVASGSVWLPDPVPFWPSVQSVSELLAERPSALSGPEPEPVLLFTSPITVTGLPEASTGVVASGSVWLPDPVPFWPSVESVSELLAEPPSALSGPEPEPVVLFPSPIPVTWLPEASTGVVASGSVWLPDPVPFWPSVESVSELLAEPPSALSGPEPEPVLLFPSPMTVTWLPEVLAGAWAW